MRAKFRTMEPLAVLASCLSACGGGSGGGIALAPPPLASPAPTPTPAPTPAAFQPVPATIFAGPMHDPALAVLGKGWQHDYVPNTAGARDIRNADSFSVSYDKDNGTYLVDVPVAGSGTIMRTGNYGTYPFEYPTALAGFPAEPSNKNPTSYCCNALSISAADQAQSPYRYASFIDFFAPGPAGSNLDTIAYGTFAVLQPAKAGEVPTTGTARYTGDVFGHFAGDASATWLEGTSRFDFDFARATLGGDITVSMRCTMGCNYDDVTYSLTNSRFAQGSTSFSGVLTTVGAPSDGSFSGMFAGPDAAEMASQFQLPFFNPEWQRWMTAGGAIVGKRD